ncbi:PREDICTED: GDP-D-glucose phosphorylase 1 [Ceratosolen solmsi marchali]|uniref:GDP-D-glucose phosphorylase 1 n=1 Tax=Ceratosolen solmsi marchali TaxID=326594 RepID=A0AAJ7DXJ1_9HYME|nr:PREDICTED: GDP-D-glucose phosphorylase 1 [Ceratosolen solmsi marchali]
MAKSAVEFFSYTEKDFHFQVQCNNEDSNFDILLKRKWAKAEEDNLLRYSVKVQQTKVVEGKYGFYAQLNIERATLRRRPDDITSMIQPFDSEKFNFMKIPQNEILFNIGNCDENDIIAVNVSPILWGHSLFVSKCTSGLPQQATLHSFKKAIELVLLSNSENMRVLFNSLCANASVNHLHWHFYYLNHRMLLESISLEYFIGSVYILHDFPAKGFCIKFSSFDYQDINKYASYAYKIVSCLQENQIAHNIYITRSKTDKDKDIFDDIRIYIWARKPSYGIKNTNDFIIAACELFGHLPIRSQEAYESMHEQYISEYLNDNTNDAFLSAQKLIEEILSQNVENKNDLTLS